MTFREFASINKPNIVRQGFLGGVWGCPSDYKWERKRPKDCKLARNDKSGCTACWDRVMEGMV